MSASGQVIVVLMDLRKPDIAVMYLQLMDETAGESRPQQLRLRQSVPGRSLAIPTPVAFKQR
jgi:hypothetical protein